MKTLLLIFIFTSLSFAQYTTPNTGVEWGMDDLVTNSGGVVTGSFPNYTMNNKVIVLQADKIIIAAGTSITFTAATGGFEVNGILKALGTAADSILFTSTVEDSTGFCEGLRFNQNTSADVSMIYYTRIQFADYGMRVIDSSPVMADCFMYKCGRGVQLSGSNAQVLNTRIERVYEYGILINLNSNPLIEGNTLAFNNTENTSAKNQISIGLQGNNSPVIRNNTIYGGWSVRTGGISLWVSGAGSFSNAIIEGNTIFNNSFGMTMLSSSNGVINAVIKNNLIYNNNLNPDVNVSGSGININGSPFNAPIITGNEIFGNWWGVTIQNGTVVQPGPNPNLGNIENANPDDDGLNIIYNNIQPAGVFDLYNNCTNDIWAQNNDWRVYDSVSIEAHIFHKVDNPNHGLVKFMPFSPYIPVELVSFTASAKESNVLLEWTTATETNNHAFEIERRSQLADKGSFAGWNNAGIVYGSGTSTQPVLYSFVDEKLPPGIYNYRLKQIDVDGSFEYSQTIEVEVTAPAEFILFQNYPNPFNPATKIKFEIPGKARNDISLITLKVFDVLGREVATLVNEYKEAGKHSVEFNATGLPSGVYFYRLNAGSFSETKKMILLR